MTLAFLKSFASKSLGQKKVESSTILGTSKSSEWLFLGATLARSFRSLFFSLADLVDALGEESSETLPAEEPSYDHVRYGLPPRPCTSTMLQADQHLVLSECEETITQPAPLLSHHSRVSSIPRAVYHSQDSCL